MASILPLLTIALLPMAADPIDLLDQAAWLKEEATTYEQLDEGFVKAQAARLDLIEMAIACRDSEWPALRDRLILNLGSENRGVWMACCQALSRRDPEALSAALVSTLQNGGRTDREGLIANALARIGAKLSPESRDAAVTVLAGRIEDLSRPCDRQRMMLALGAMEDAATEDLLRIAADPILFELIRSELPHALAATHDGRALPLLTTLHAQADSDGERTACVLALGNLARHIANADHLVHQANASIRTDFLTHESPTVAGAAALALARIGRFVPATDAESLFQLAEYPAARENAMRAVLESQMPIDDKQRQLIEQYAQDEASNPAVRKVAQAILVEK